MWVQETKKSKLCGQHCQQSVKNFVWFVQSPKDILPLSSVGCLNFMTFGWVTPIMIKVYRNGVDYVKTLQLSQEDSAETSAMR